LNTPIHLAAQFNSLDVLKFLVNIEKSQLLIEQTVFLFNEDGLNPFLLASRHGDVHLVRFLLETYSTHTSFDMALILLNSLDLVNFKNCMHYALSQDSKTSHLIVRHLIEVATARCCSSTSNNKLVIDSGKMLAGLVGAVSKLVGSVYHVAASNLTRMKTLWYLLNLDKKQAKLGLEHGFTLDASILDRLDFREFSTIDCLVDSLMNLREMAPANCKCLQTFYNSILKGNKISVPYDSALHELKINNLKN
jgi:ankyrin repeat protein